MKGIRKIKILIVDDAVNMRKLQKNILQKIGNYTILEASNGEEALVVLDKETHSEYPIDLLILDWNMPKINGLEFLKICRSHPNYKNLPILMISCEIDKKCILEAFTHGVNDYLMKPFTEEMIEEKINKFIATHIFIKGS